MQFQFFDPRPHDFWTVKDFLKYYVIAPPTSAPSSSSSFSSSSAASSSSSSSSSARGVSKMTSAESAGMENGFDCTELAKIICEQPPVGTMIKTEDVEEYPIGFASVLNFQARSTARSVQQIKRFLLSHCPPARRQQLQSLMEDATRPLGLFIHERMINLPSELVPPLHEAVFADLEWVQQNGAHDEEKQHYSFENFLLLSRCFYDRDAVPPPDRPEPSSPPPADDDGASFYKFEDECYNKASFLSFRFAMSLPSPVSPSEVTQQLFVVSTFNKSKVPSILKSLQASLRPAFPGF